MDGFDLERNGLSPDQIHALGEGFSLPLTLAEQNNSVVVVGLNPGVEHYLNEEGFRVIFATPEEAFETIRWEQPAFALVAGGLHGEASFVLQRRLAADLLTRQLDLIIWVAEAPVQNAYNKRRQALYLDNFEDLRSALRQRRAITGPRLKLESSKPQAPVAIPGQTGKPPAALKNLLANPRLRKFVDEVIDSWATLRLAAYLGEQPDAVVNLEMLCYMLDLDPLESAEAIRQMARAGYIEPLEFEEADPLYAPVAHADYLAILNDLSLALQVPEYRMALATLILARERTGK